MTASSTTERRAVRGAIRQKAVSPGAPKSRPAPLSVAVPAPRLAAPKAAKAVPGFAVGDIYLAALPDLGEVEVEDVVLAAQTIKIKGHGWIDLAAFEAAVKAKLGRVIYTAGLLGLKRKFIRQT